MHSACKSEPPALHWHPGPCHPQGHPGPLSASLPEAGSKSGIYPSHSDPFPHPRDHSRPASLPLPSSALSTLIDHNLEPRSSRYMATFDRLSGLHCLFKIAPSTSAHNRAASTSASPCSFLHICIPPPFTSRISCLTLHCLCRATSLPSCPQSSSRMTASICSAP